MNTFRRAAIPALIPLSRWMIRRGSERAPMAWMLRSIPKRDREAIREGGGWDMVTRSYLEAVSSGPRSMLEEGELYLEPWDFALQDIKTPLRLWHGRADANLPCEVAQRLAEKIPGCEGRWVDGEGHYSLAIYHSGEVLDWLAS
jgi:pimeloyl-ACP methyl ester carboxylesterase